MAPASPVAELKILPRRVRESVRRIVYFNSNVLFCFRFAKGPGVVAMDFSSPSMWAEAVVPDKIGFGRCRVLSSFELGADGVLRDPLRNDAAVALYPVLNDWSEG